jgi:acyl carrier protein
LTVETPIPIPNEESQSMSQAKIYSFLNQVFADVFRRDDVELHPGLSAKDVVGWDSLRQVEINLALEEKFNIRIRTREMRDVSNIGDLVALVARKIGSAQ